MITIIDTSWKKNSLHSLEFVKPVADCIDEKETFIVLHYTEFTKERLEETDKIIICGNGLEDQGFLEHTRSFAWIKTTRKPVLGICAGCQMICKVLGGKLTKKEVIAVSRIQPLDPDVLLGKMSKFEVYELHTKGITLPQGCTELAETDVPLAFKKNDAPVYGILWHPEVMNKELITAFSKMKFE